MKFSLITFLLWICQYAAAQEIRYDHVDFLEGPAWEEVLKQAQRTGKVIFLDAFTTWCGPCKKMEKQVFTQPETANFFNQKFINVKYDMERGEGVDLKKRYGVKVFPTYLFITGSGEVIHKIVGAYFEAGEFLQYSRMSVTPGQRLVDLHQRYRNGERNSDLMFSYFKALRLAGEEIQEEQLVKDYFALMSKDHFMDETYWGIVKAFLKDPSTREFRILVENRDEIGQAIGMEEVDRKIFDVFNEQIQVMSRPEGSTISRVNEDAMISLLRNSEFPERNELLARALAAQYYRNGSYYEYAGVVDAMLDFKLLNYHTDPLQEFDYHAGVFCKVVLEKELLKKALRWSEYACSHEEDPQKKKAYLLTREKLEKKIAGG